MYYDSLPSSTTAPIDESSLGSFRFSDLQPRMHKTELRSNAKLTFVLMYPMTSAYDSMLFSLIFKARRDITLDADGPAPPVHAKTRGLKVLFSTSIIRCSYFNFH